MKPGSAYINTSGRIIPTVPVLNIVEAEPFLKNGQIAQAQTPNLSPDSDSTTPTELTTSPRTEEFAMTPLQPSPDVDPADSFGLMSPSSTEFASSPFDRSVLLAQLGMGSMNPDDPPRRTASLKLRPRPIQQVDSTRLAQPDRPPRLRGKISSPSLREQQQLQSWQATLEASLPNRAAQPSSVDNIDEALMSPRATEFTQNPFAISLSVPAAAAAATEETPSTTDFDPRSPAQKGVSPITRSILDVL